jgi:cytochrome c-type biogenesis protein CcmH
MKRVLAATLRGVLIVLAVTAGTLRAEPPPVQYPEIPLTPSQETHYRTLLFTLRCLVCQNESLLDSDAPLAADLRQKVRKRIAAGETDDQIKKYLTDRYGDFVLYKPPLQRNTVLLWTGPFVLAAIGLIALIAFARRSRARAVTRTVDEAAVKRLLEEDL